MDTADVLEKAAVLLKTVGWTQGTSWERAAGLGQITAYCAEGACWVAAGLPTNSATTSAGAPTERALYVGALRLLEEQVGERAVAEWNDALTRTQADVIDAMEKAAKEFRNKAVAL